MDERESRGGSGSVPDDAPTPRPRYTPDAQTPRAASRHGGCLVARRPLSLWPARLAPLPPTQVRGYEGHGYPAFGLGALKLLGRCLWEGGHLNECVAVRRRAFELHEAHTGAGLPLTLDALADLAEVGQGTGGPARGW